MVTQSYTISTVRTATPPRVKMSQYDHGSRTIVFTVVDSTGTEVTLTGYTVTVEGTRIDGHAFATVCTVSGATATFTETVDMTNASGSHPAELVVTDGTGRLGTMNFVLDVEPYAMNEDATITEEDETLFQQLYEKLYTGSPATASTVAEMTDTDAVYLYTGSETGYTAGNWYYYDGSDWVSGGTYGSAAVDDELSTSSTNAVQNKVITAEISDLQSAINVIKIINTASGDIASFADGADNQQIQSLVVNVEPVQDLSNGDPSPTNICPITGWTGMTVERSSTQTTIVNNNTSGGVTVTANADNSITVKGLCTSTASLDLYRNEAIFPSGISAGGQYVVSIGNTIDSFEMYSFKGAAVTALASFANATHATFTVPSDATGMLIRILVKSGTNYNVKLNVRLCPYSGYENIPVSWTDEAGTVYGGTLDLISGVLTVTDANIASYAGESLPSTWISDRDVYAEGTTPTTGAQVVYKLATATTVQLTAQQLATLKGDNNIWADCGSIASVTYPADTKLYIDQAIATAIAAL